MIVDFPSVLVSRFWHHAKAANRGNVWTARLPLLSTDKPLWVYANLVYPLKKPVAGAGYYYSPYMADRFNLSSPMRMVSPEQFKAAEVHATMQLSLVIETFEDDWRKEWFTYKPEDWARRTHKLYDDRWQTPADATLALEVRSAKTNKMVVGIDEFAAEIALQDGGRWQNVRLSPTDFQDVEGKSLPNWDEVGELRLGATETLRASGRGARKSRVLGASWQGPKPEFRNLRWIAEVTNNE